MKRIVSMVVILAGLWGWAGISPYAGLWQVVFKGSSSATAERDWSRSVWAVPEGADWQTQRRRELGPILAYNFGDPSSKSKVASAVHGDEVHWFDYSQVAYAGFIYLEGDKTYKFRSNIDDDCYLKIVDAGTKTATVLLDFSDNAPHTSEAFSVSRTGWHACEIRMGNGYGGAGGNARDSSVSCGFSGDGGQTWRKLMDPGDGSLFRIHDVYPVRLGLAYSEKASLSCVLTQDRPHREALAVFAYADTIDKGPTNVTWASHFSLGAWPCGSTNFVARLAALPASARIVRFAVVPNGDWPRATWLDAVKVEDVREREESAPAFLDCVIGSVDHTSANLVVNVLSQGLGGTSATLLKQVCREDGEWEMDAEAVKTASDLVGSLSVVQEGLCPGAAYRLRFAVSNNLGKVVWSDSVKVTTAAESFGNSTSFPGLWQARFVGANADWTKNPFDVAEGTDWQTQRRRELGPLLAYATREQRMTSRVWDDQVYWLEQNDNQWIYVGYIHLEASRAYKFRSKIDDNERITITDFGTGRTTTLLEDTIGRSEVLTSAAYTPSVTGWHRIEIRFSDGAGGAGGYDSASDFLNTNNLGFSSDDGATWQLLLDPGDGSLLLPERPEPVRVCETFFDGTTLAAALGRNEPPPSETGHANVFAVFDTAYHGDTLSAWPTARRVGLGVWKGAASTFVAQVAGFSGMRYLRFVTVSPDGARQHWSETICLPETPRRDGARAVFHAAHVTMTNTASASFHVDLLSQGTNCTAATLGFVYAYTDAQGRHCMTNIIAEGASIAGSYDHEIKSIPAGTAYTAYFFVVDNHGVATRYPEGADGIAFSTFPASYILSACAESAVVRYDARTNYPGRLVRGTLTVGDVEGRVPSPWDTSLLADGWHRVSRGGAESDELMVLNNPEVEIEEGRIELNEVWTAEKTHLVRNTIYIPLWRRLKIEAGAVVKFCEGTGIKIEDGGALEIVGEEGRDVIFTSADDDSVGVKIVGVPSGGVPLRGIWRQSGNAIFSDNNFVQMRGMAYGDYATVSMNDTVAFRASGVANVPVTLNGANRKQPFSIDWVARDGSAKLGADYTLAAGRVTWGQSDDGTKIISIPLVVDHRVGSNTVFSIEIITNRAVNVGRRACTVTVREWDTLDIRTDRKESAAVRFDARTNTPGRVVHGVEAVTAGGNDDERTVSDWDTTTLADGWNTLTKGTNTLALLTLNDPRLAVEGGRLAKNTLWASNVTHVLRNTVVVPRGVMLTVTTNAVVKFMEGTGIKVEDGGRLNVVGAPGEDVIFTAANDGTAGASVPGVGEGEISHRGFWKQSAGAAFADNGFIQTRNWRTGLYPEVWLNDTTAFRSTGMAAIPVTINGMRDQALSIEWRAVDGTAKYGVDYTLKAGRVAWNKANEGTKIIEIPLVKERVVGTPVSFTLEMTVNRGVNVSRRVCTVEIREFETRAFASAHAASAATRFDARRTTLFKVCHGTEWIAGGLLDTTTFKDGWRGVSGLDAGTNATTGIYCLNRPQIAVEEGRLARNTLWTSNATHVLRNWVVVPRGVTLTVTTNAVVKMFPETGIRIEDGGRLDVVGAPGADVVFTSVADDTAGEPIAGFESITNRLVGGIVAQSGAATFTDNAWIQTRSFGWAPGYGTVTLHDAAADRANGVVYVPLTIATNRKQPFSVDWVATDGTAKHGTDYTDARGTVTWNRADDGTKWIRVPLTPQKTGERRTFSIALTTARGILVARGAATVTIDELDAAKTHGAVTLAESVASGVFAIDEKVQAQPIFLEDAVPVTYSGRWQGQRAARETIARVSVESDNGLVRLGEFPGDAEDTLTLDLSAYRTGCYTLRHEILAKGEEKPLHTATKTFSVVDRDSVELHGGTLTGNETWKAGKVHVVYATVVVPGIYTLFIEPGAIVKFMTGTGIDISQGGALFANGIVFTHINDDTVGGDTLSDGYTVAPPMDAYFLSGNFTFGDDAELRNVTQKTALTGTLNGTKMLSKGSTYRVSGTFTVANGATLTIPAGTVLKMEQGAQIVVNAGGTLKANGTRAAPVVFTSINDDSYSGKTEGSNSNPQPGDWTRIAVNGTAFFDFTRILYSSRNSTTGAINMNGGTTTFINSEIAHCAYDAVGVESGHFYMTNSIITDALLAFRHWARDPIVNSVIYNCGRLTQGGGQHFVNCVFSQISETWEAFGFPQNGTTYRNCVFWNEGGSVLTGEGHQDALTVCGKNGNIWGDPLFVDPANGDFRIREGSPCVDAADSLAAPEQDYFSQPRITFTGRTNDTELAEGPLADIGICEVMPRDVTSDIDLVPEAVRTEKTATPGQLLFVKWEVRNQGGAPVDATWRDTVSLVSQDGREVVLGDKTTKSVIAVGGSVFCSGYFTVPAMAEGTWYLKVNVNSYHDIFEGSLYVNNALVSEASVKVALPGLELSDDGTATIVVRANGESAIRLPEEAATGKLLVIRTSGALTAWAGFGRVMSSEVSPSSAIQIADGVWILKLSSEDDTYISLRNDSNDDSSVELSLENAGFYLYESDPVQLPNSGTASLGFTGAGFDETLDVWLERGSVKIPAIDLNVETEHRAVAVFDVTGSGVGEYTLFVKRGEEVLSYTALRLSQAKADGKWVCRLDVASTVRRGRVYRGKFEYSNAGNVPIDAPYVKLSAENGTLIRLTEHDPWTDTIEFMAISGTYPASRLKGLESGELAFLYKTTGTGFRINYNVVTENKNRFPWDVNGEYMRPADMSDEAWAQTLSTLRANVGETWNDYLARMRRACDYLMKLGRATPRIDRIWQMEVNEAFGADTAMSALAGMTDLVRSGRGIGLSFTRTYRAQRTSRIQKGRLGYGWRDNYSIRAVVHPVIQWTYNPSSVPGSAPARTRTFGAMSSSSVRSRLESRFGQLGWEARELIADGARIEIKAPSGTQEFELRDGEWTPCAAFDRTKVTLTQTSVKLEFVSGMVLEFLRSTGRLYRVMDNQGNSLAFSYSGDNLIKVVHSDGQSLSFTYQDNGLISSVSDDQGRRVSYAYEDGDLVSSTAVDGLVTRYRYASEGLLTERALVQITYPNGVTKDFAYDERGRVSTIAVNGNRFTTEIVRGEYGSYSIVAPNGGVTEVMVGASGEVLKTVNALGQETRRRYTEEALLESVIAPSGKRSKIAYNQDGLPVSSMSASGAKTTFSYAPAFDSLTSVTDAKGHAISYGYDEKGRGNTISHVDGSSSLLEYDERGDIVKSVNRRGGSVSYGYDDEGRLARKVWSNGRFFTQAYDAKGNVTNATDSVTGAVMMEYDDRERLIRIVHPKNRGFTYKYDTLGRMVERATLDGTRECYGYDELGRLAYVTDGEKRYLTNAYDPVTGWLATQTYGNGVVVSNAYDILGRTAGIYHLKGGRRLAFFEYAYDRDGKCISQKTAEGMERYAYDADSQLTGVTYPDGTDEQFAYDVVGNRTTANGAAYEVNALNQYVAVSGGNSPVLMAYDLDGNLISQADDEGTTLYAYDILNRLVAVTNEARNIRWSCEYDAFGNRTSVTDNGKTTEKLFVQGSLASVVAEYVGGVQTRYHVMVGAVRLADVDATSGIHYYHADMLGSVRLLTDGAGGEKWRGSYRAFGGTRKVTGEMTEATWVGTLGVEKDTTGLVFMRNRYYDEKVGRFIQMDPIGLKAGDVNLYRYCGNNSEQMVDISGLIGETTCVSLTLGAGLVGNGAVCLGTTEDGDWVLTVTLGGGVGAGVSGAVSSLGPSRIGGYGSMSVSGVAGIGGTATLTDDGVDVGLTGALGLAASATWNVNYGIPLFGKSERARRREAENAQKRIIEEEARRNMNYFAANGGFPLF